ncbi:hypothetical protein IHE49_15330 [Rhodanobacter sp. 7MK24]|uniref:hypothetical protein n=1 Tax=Rhodanobacter sp. 7MK24 TaxID=2775922 RepID=UPI001786A843|nr:hypothetical protein [Rhodanobacter sp. 7MK24]MBD8881858.1 hypothetical protein [Rhodanobacter sp. 7MK24]
MVAPKQGQPVDFSELWVGASAQRTGRGGQFWNGGFAGRPVLADQLWPAIKLGAVSRGYSALHICLGGLREFWRFLDGYEQRFGAVQSLADIDEVKGLLWLHPPDDGDWKAPTLSYYSQCRFILQQALALTSGKDRLFVWPPYPDRNYTVGKDVPDQAQSRAALTLLKREAQAIYARWRRADALAAEGRNLMQLPRKRRNSFGTVTEADVHATYRAVIVQTGDPLPTISGIRVALGLRPHHNLPFFWACLGLTLMDIQLGLYPSMDDLQCLSQLFMARSGWNPSTVAALNISNPNWAVSHGDPAHDLWMIESWKERSRDWQQTICRGRMTTAPLQIVRALLGRTEALRSLLSIDASRAKDCTNVERALCSPWLAAGQKNCTGLVVALGTDETRPSVYWRRCVRQHNEEARAMNAAIDRDNAIIAANNATRPEASPRTLLVRRTLIPESMTPSDWRDIYANFVFVESRYSWVMVQWALGHKHLTSTRHYLRSKLWRRFSEKKLLDVQVTMFDELRHGRLDLVVVRARVELGVDPSDDDRARLDAHRQVIHARELTSSGYQCQRPFHPPQEIDPGNPSDGTMRCRRGERCPGCPQAYAVDSFAMVKRLVELERIRCQVSMVIWIESQLAGDLDMLQHDLRQWPEEEVARHRRYWEAEFESGRRVLDPWSGHN